MAEPVCDDGFNRPLAGARYALDASDELDEEE